MKPAIEVKNISKSYQINHKNKASYNTLKDDFSKLFMHPFKKDANVDKEETFWALDDISFSVNPGEIFGIVGRNGSGKSTLLKILSRIVEPTKGEAMMRGRVASLLEVGTGFNPELTGRENIYFNGSMLGMSKKEITRKFNEIVWFSEVEKFLDTPVKFYSSGMYVRLAFSVAAHLEPDILILDEVLAVGDASFQKKSLNKILETMNDGRTVLFVSHSMASVQQLCSRGMLLKDGKIDTIGSVGEVTERYNDLMRQEEVIKPITYEWEASDKDLKFINNDFFIPSKIYLTDDTEKLIKGTAPNNINKWLTIEAEVLQESDLYTIGYMIKNQHKQLIYMNFSSDLPDKQQQKLKKGRVTMRSRIPPHLLNEGEYQISLVGGIYNKFWIFDPESRTPTIEISIKDGLSDSKFWKNQRSGILAPIMDWEIK